MADKIQLKRGLAANWTSSNPILAQGELGYELDTFKLKLGDGTTAWNDLDYRFSDDQIALEVIVTAIGNLTSTNVQDALEELQSDIDNLNNNAISDHGNLSGLGDDDHTQYHNDTRGDIRYYQKSEVDNLLQAQDEASELGYDDTNTSLGSTDIQSAIENLVTRFTKEYFQASQITNQTNITNTDSVLATIENQNSNNSVFDFTSNNLTINKNGRFQFNINITADTNTGARETLEARLQRFNGTSYVDIPNTEAHSIGYSYHRNNNSGEDTISINPILTVTSGQQFRIVLRSPTNGVDTIAKGTGFNVEEK